jgi:hypothetical protein
VQALKKRRKPLAVLFAVVAIFALAADSCDGGDSAQDKESGRQQSSYERLTRAEPAEEMSYSPTRRTINTWIRTWNQPNQLSFTYLLNQDGSKVGYYVFLGPPVSYCAALTPTYKGYDFKNDDNDGEDAIVPAPSVDGVYYSGGQCIQYYGVDATTGQLIEFTVGGTLNFVNSTQPLYLDVPALGYTQINDLTKKDGKYVLK